MSAVISAVLSVLVSLAAIPLSGEAAPPPDTHCVVFVVDQKPDGKLIVSEPECFADEAAAEARATEGHESWAESFSEVSSFVLGKHFDGFNGSGSSISVVGSSCTGGYWNTGSTWANRISSSYNGCYRLKHWELPNKSGASENTYGVGKTNNLGSLNNRVQSVSYHSS